MRLRSLKAALADVPNFRQAQGRRHDLLPVLLLCCVAVMCGARSRAIISRGGDYLLLVKENQLALRQDIALVFAHPAELADTIGHAQTNDRHGDGDADALPYARRVRHSICS
jgi:hypothetical protein